jgi:hypothetical protein
MISSIITNLVNLLQIYLLVFLAKFKKKKIIFFYYPNKQLRLSHNFYIEYIFEDYSSEEYCIIYGHQEATKLGEYYFNIGQSYLKFLIGIDFFISNNICDVFPKRATKIFIHHNLYDDPWVRRDKEKKMCQRLIKYDYILVATTATLIRANETFLRYDFINKPKVVEVGYPKLDYLLRSLRNKKIKKKYILIAPTLVNGFMDLSIVSKLKKTIEKLLSNTDFDIVLRPHPRDRQLKSYLFLKDKFSKNQRFHYDLSDNYFDIYTKSKLMITDLSGTAYTFAFLSLSPVIFLSIDEKKIEENEYSNYNFFLDREKIGHVISNEHYVIDKIKLILKDYNLYEKNIIKLRKNMKYLNKSTVEIKNFIEKITR